MARIKRLRKTSARIESAIRRIEVDTQLLCSKQLRLIRLHRCELIREINDLRRSQSSILFEQNKLSKAIESYKKNLSWAYAIFMLFVLLYLLIID